MAPTVGHWTGEDKGWSTEDRTTGAVPLGPAPPGSSARPCGEAVCC
ncbi:MULTISPECIES: hypothetical protein [Kocuria]|nr:MULTISPECIES: hypothetical protein [Kocuria]MCT1544742.1 hypothetical protein [Kocuria rhizophila]MCT2171359.1 hypothetical protein [Kocuria rhizophila]MDN3461312.1 hypothetical protein [Kocuria sp. APC 4018]